MSGHNRRANLIIKKKEVNKLLHIHSSDLTQTSNFRYHILQTSAILHLATKIIQTSFKTASSNLIQNRSPTFSVKEQLKYHMKLLY